MKRRDFFKTAGISSAALVSLPAFAKPAPAPAKAAGHGGQDEEHEHEHGDDHDEPKGALANATIAFGEWNSDPPLDRFPNNSPIVGNNHHLLPGEVTIKAGGSVSFIISGFHLVLVYGPGTKPSDINRGLTVAPTTQPAPPLISDPVNRVYRGIDPSVFPVLAGGTARLQDRVEVVRFQNPGRYLVICGVLPHFFDMATGEFMMFGYVRVLK
jgi:hypothetical protein